VSGAERRAGLPAWMKPKPPALVTAAASSPVLAPAIGAATTGVEMSGPGSQHLNLLVRVCVLRSRVNAVSSLAMAVESRSDSS
jgi:hypothetical protein